MISSLAKCTLCIHGYLSNADSLPQCTHIIKGPVLFNLTKHSLTVCSTRNGERNRGETVPVHVVSELSGFGEGHAVT